MKRLDKFTLKALEKKIPVMESVRLHISISAEDTLYFTKEALSVDTVWRQPDSEDEPKPDVLLCIGGITGYAFSTQVEDRPVTTQDALETDAQELMLVSRIKDGWLLTEYTGVKEVVAELMRQGESNAEKILGVAPTHGDKS